MKGKAGVKSKQFLKITFLENWSIHHFWTHLKFPSSDYSTHSSKYVCGSNGDWNHRVSYVAKKGIFSCKCFVFFLKSWRATVQCLLLILAACSCELQQKKKKKSAQQYVLNCKSPELLSASLCIAQGTETSPKQWGWGLQPEERIWMKCSHCAKSRETA